MKRYSFYLIFTSFSITGCITEDCPPDEFIGTVNMSSISKSLLPYEGVTGLVFSNDNSEEIRLLSQEGLIDSFAINCVFKPCTVPLVDETCQNVHIETRRIKFNNDSIEIYSTVFWERPHNTGAILDTSFVETIETVIRDNAGEFVRTHFLSNSREVSFTSGYLNTRSVEQFDEITLIDSTFFDVYSQSDLMWYSVNKGLVGFRFGDNMYELQEILR